MRRIAVTRGAGARLAGVRCAAASGEGARADRSLTLLSLPGATAALNARLPLLGSKPLLLDSVRAAGLNC